jgi:hypothetical protein
MTETQDIAAANVNESAIFFGDILCANNMRSNGEYDLNLVTRDLFLAKQILQNWQSRKPGVAA